MLSRYPAISHTFFLKEVLGLRERGLWVETASINPPDRKLEQLPQVEAEEARATFYVKYGGAVQLAARVLSIVARHPGAAGRGLMAALRLGGWDLQARAYALFYFAEALLVGDWMRRRHLTHLHVHFGGPVATVGMLTSIAWQIPWSLTLHGPDEFFDQEAFYLRQKVERASFVICISDFCRSQVLRAAPSIPMGRLEVVRLGVDCLGLHPRIDDAVESGPFVLVCTGRMVAAKGHRILLESLGLLANSGIEFECALIGDGVERPALEAITARLGLIDRVHFLGAQAHGLTLERVAQADVFVLASFAEGLPVALMEAMAMGIPCISTTIAAIPEMIQSGENGVLVPPANVDMLRKAVEALGRDAGLRNRLGKAARGTVEQEYNLATNLDRLAELFIRRLTLFE